MPRCDSVTVKSSIYPLVTVHALHDRQRMIRVQQPRSLLERRAIVGFYDTFFFSVQTDPWIGHQRRYSQDIVSEQKQYVQILGIWPVFY